MRGAHGGRLTIDWRIGPMVVQAVQKPGGLRGEGHVVEGEITTMRWIDIHHNYHRHQRQF